MKYRKKRQKHRYKADNYSPNPCPIWKTSTKREHGEGSTENQSKKRRTTGEERVQRNRILQEALDAEMIRRLSAKIKNCILGNGNTDQLKQTCLEQKRIEKGTIIDAEISNNLDSGSIEEYIRQKRNKKNITFWTDVVEEHFDRITLQLQQEKATASESSVRAKSDITKENLSNKDTSRACSVQLSSILRNDLPEDISLWVQKKLKASLEHTTDYLTDFSVRLYMIILLLQKNTFKITGDNLISLSAAKGVEINTVLPVLYQSKDEEFLAPHYESESTDNEFFLQQMKTLFGSAHLSAIHSTYYGEEGIQKQTLKNYPLHEAITKLMPSDKTSDFKSEADTHAMKLALAGYMTNFFNMWKKSDRFYKLLNKLLLVLLKVHLAPTRERHYKNCIAKKKQEKIERRETPQKLANKTRNSLRRLFKKEREKQKYYQKKVLVDQERKKVWEEKAEMCKQRILEYEETLRKERKSLSPNRTKNVSQNVRVINLEFIGEAEQSAIESISDLDEDQEHHNETDLSRRRLFHLQSIIRGLLLKSSKKSITVKDLKDICGNIEDKEISVCMLLFNLISPYIPDRKNRGTFSYQLPFMLMSNQIFVATGYFNSVTKLCPIVRPGSLSSLRMDAAGLYSLFSSKNAKENPLRVFDHNNQEITSKQAATEQKDAMFGSYFDLPKIFQASASYGHNFGHYMIFLPGLKTVRLIGEIQKFPPSHACIEVQEQQEQTSSMVNRPPTQNSELQNKEERLKTLRREQSEVIKQLKLALKERKEVIVTQGLPQQIKLLKGQWKKDQNIDYNQVLFLKINQLKEIRDELYRKVFILSNKKKEVGSAIYHINRSLYSPEDKEPAVTKKKLINSSRYKCFEKTENLQIDEELLDRNLCMAGTDNGIVTMTETCQFGLKKFEYHLKLYNRYEVLENEEVTEEDKAMSYIPKTMKITSKDIQYRSGGKSAQIKLIEKKKSSEKGQQIIEIEKELSEASLWTAKSIDDLKIKYSKHDGHKANLRDFYYSKNSIKQRRRSELLLQRSKDRICSEERKFAGEKSKPIMFVGDRGYGVGSHIKGHVKYGGRWKPLINSRYTSVCITNEHNTSQTCVFCYEKLDHPMRTSVSKNGALSLRTVKGTFVCLKKKCVLQKLSATHKARDAVSALAIGLSGAASLILDTTFPALDPQNSQFKSEHFKKNAVAFLKRNASRPAVKSNTF